MKAREELEVLLAGLKASLTSTEETRAADIIRVESRVAAAEKAKTAAEEANAAADNRYAGEVKVREDLEILLAGLKASLTSTEETRAADIIRFESRVAAAEQAKTAAEDQYAAEVKSPLVLTVATTAFITNDASRDENEDNDNNRNDNQYEQRRSKKRTYDMNIANTIQ